MDTTMLQFIFAAGLLALALFGIALRKTYDYLPARELKRQARGGDEVARALYRAVAYGASLRVLLWLFIGATAALGFVLLAQVPGLPVFWAFMLVALLLWYGFVWMPTAPVTTLGARLVVMVTPLIAGVLNYLHPFLSRVAATADKRRAASSRTALYERSDLLEFLEAQKHMADSRIDGAEIDMAIHALTFGERSVGEIMVPRRVVKMVNQSDRVGPILMKELYDSGHSRFPVYNGNADVLVGMLYLRDLIEGRQSGTVADVDRKEVYYVHEDETLYQVLHAFLKTKHHLFVVINSFEEFVGIITIEDVLEQVIGRKIEDEFDKYDDMRAVAAQHALKEHKTHKAVPETVTEVVE